MLFIGERVYNLCKHFVMLFPSGIHIVEFAYQIDCEFEPPLGLEARAYVNFYIFLHPSRSMSFQAYARIGRF